MSNFYKIKKVSRDPSIETKNKPRIRFFNFIKKNWIFLFLFLIAFLLRVYHINRRWIGGADGFTGARISQFAINHVRYGYLTTKGGNVLNYGYEPALNFRYYINHPPLPGILLSVVFKLFGIHEWVATSLSIFFNLGSIILLYLLVNEVLGKKIAILSTFFMVFVPMDVYYGRMAAAANPSIMLFLALLAFSLYFKWQRENDLKYLIGLYIILLLGTWAGWYAFFIIPTILIHYFLINNGKTKNSGFIYSLLTLGALSFGLTVIYQSYLIGGSPFSKLLSKLKGASGVLYDIGFIAFFKRLYLYLWGLVGPIILMLSLCWILWIIYNLMFKKLILNEDKFIFTWLIFGLFALVLYRRYIFIYDEYFLYYLLPFFMVSSARILVLILDRSDFLKKYQILIILLIGLIFIYSSLSYLNFKFEGSECCEGKHYIIDVFEEIKDKVPPTAKIYGSTDYLIYHNQMFYLDREYEQVDNLDTFKKLMKDEDGPIYYLHLLGAGEGITEISIEFVNYLKDARRVIFRHPHKKFDLYILNETLDPEIPEFQKEDAINFDNKLMFLGYIIDKDILQQNKGKYTFFDSYLTPRMMLKYNDSKSLSFHLTLYWQVLDDLTDPYYIYTDIEGYYIVLLSDSKPLINLDKGHVIKMDYYITPISSYPPVKYYMKIKASRNGTLLNGTYGDNKTTKGVVEFGTVEVLPPKSKLIFQEKEPIPTYLVNKQINDRLYFIGYDLENNKVSAGYKISMTTYWKIQKEIDQDYLFYLQLTNGSSYKVEKLVKIIPTRLWPKGKYVTDQETWIVEPQPSDGQYETNLLYAFEPNSKRYSITLKSINISSSNTELDRTLDSYQGITKFKRISTYLDSIKNCCLFKI